MKKVFRVLGFLLLAVILLLASGAAFIHLRGVPTYPVKAIKVVVKSDSTCLARGEHLVSLICADCHRGEGNVLSGKHMIDVPAMFGYVYSANLTFHTAHGIGKWTEAEFAESVRYGKRRGGG